MKLYYKTGACSLIIRIILNEMNLAFDDAEVDLRTKTYEGNQNYKAINPKGSVPALALDNGEILTENAVIVQYLADNFPQQDLLPGVRNFERYRVLEWLNFMATDVHKGFSPLFNPAIPDTIKADVVKPLLKSKFAYINQQLHNHSYLHKDTFTLPDAYLYVMLRWAVGQQIQLNELNDLVHYVERLQKRDAIKKSLKQEQLSELHF